MGKQELSNTAVRSVSCYQFLKEKTGISIKIWNASTHNFTNFTHNFTNNLHISSNKYTDASVLTFYTCSCQGKKENNLNAHQRETGKIKVAPCKIQHGIYCRYLYIYGKGSKFKMYL